MYVKLYSEKTRKQANSYTVVDNRSFEILAAWIAGLLVLVLILVLALPAVFFPFLHQGQKDISAVTVGLVGSLIGLVMFFPLRALSLRVVRRVMADLIESESRYRSVVASLREGVLVVDRRYEVVASNESARRILGDRLRDWVRAERCAEWMLAEDGGAMAVEEHPLRRALSTGLPSDGAVAGVRVGESVLWIAVDARPLCRPGEEKPHEVAMAITDVTERRRAEDALRLAAQAFDNTTDGIMTTDSNKRIVSVNRAFTAITGYAAEEVIGQTPAILQSGRHDREFYERMWQTINATGSWQGEIWNRTKSGEVYPEWLNVGVVKDRRGRVTHYVGAFSNISIHKRDEEARLRRLAHHDTLTGLPNRASFHERCDALLAHARRLGHDVAILFVDLDHFKTINDSLGHAIGDELLKAAAARMRDGLRADDLVARLGGDEFVIALSGIKTPEDVGGVAHNLIRRLTLPFQVAGHELFVSASIGVSCFPSDGQDTRELLKHADIAMYRAKDKGRSGYQFFLAEMNLQAREILEVRSRLQFALQRDEFLVYFQPRLRADSGEIVGVEALIRWRNPDLGLVPPGKFIPLAEVSGGILGIGAWVLERVCLQVVEWQRLGLPLRRVSVNLSARQFREPDLVGRIRRLLEQTGLASECLELEITESMAMADPQQTVVTLRALKETGIAISIDDFGTGYSSLNYLRRFPFDYLKVDQSFVRDMLTDPIHLAVTEMIIGLGKTLGVRVVAEGVENAEELDQLRACGCDEVQGFYFAKPMPADELVAWIQTRRAEPSPAEAAFSASPLAQAGEGFLCNL